MRLLVIIRIVILSLMQFVVLFLILKASHLIPTISLTSDNKNYYDKFYGPIVITKTNSTNDAIASLKEEVRIIKEDPFSERANSTHTYSGINHDMEETMTIYPFDGNQTTTDATSKLSSKMEGSDSTFHYYYSLARRDRSGAAIQDMIMSHAYSYHRGIRYGGACSKNWNGPKYRGSKELRFSLLKSIGLETTLPLVDQCPSNVNQMLRRDDYIANDTQILSEEYLEYLRGSSIVRYNPEDEEQQTKDEGNPSSLLFTIGIHIRRGDIGPCRPLTRNYHRYLPNSHYIRLIDYYIAQHDVAQQNVKSNVQVTIYSESESYESFDVFRQRGYNVILDGSIEDVWKGLVTKDVLILSRSSFSFVPAILSRGIVVYTPFWHQPLPSWEVVNDEFMNQTISEYYQIIATNCPDKLIPLNFPSPS